MSIVRTWATTLPTFIDPLTSFFYSMVSHRGTKRRKKQIGQYCPESNGWVIGYILIHLEPPVQCITVGWSQLILGQMKSIKSKWNVLILFYIFPLRLSCLFWDFIQIGGDEKNVYRGREPIENICGRDACQECQGQLRGRYETIKWKYAFTNNAIKELLSNWQILDWIHCYF